MSIIRRPRFFVNSKCKECPLHETPPLHVCTPTAPLMPSRSLSPRTHLPALLVVGEAPGYFEDRSNTPFIGPSGQTLRQLYLRPGLKNPALWDFNAHADVYLTNAVRCRPVNNATPTIGPIRRCRRYLESDLRTLSKLYPRVLILAVGAVAVRSLLDSSLSTGLRHQPRTFKLDGLSYPVFLTYHPALMLPNRDPAKSSAIGEHLQLLLSYLKSEHKTELTASTLPTLHEAPGPPDCWSGSQLVLDIETYGILDFMPPQRYMHPAKSQAFDLIPSGGMIPLIGLAWSPNDFGYFFPSDPAHLVRLYAWLDELNRKGGSLVGANIKYDLTYFRYCHQKIPGLSPDSAKMTTLEDVFILNYLHDSQRPEHSLKALTSLFGIASYPEAIYDGLVRYPSHDSEDLLRYNALDCLATWRLHAYLRSRIAQDFGADSPKLSSYSRTWYSNLLWLLVHMTETGVTLDHSALTSLGTETSSICYDLEQRALTEWGGSIAGTGSVLFSTGAVERAADAAGLLGNRRLVLSDSTKRISTSKKNTKFIISHLPPDSQHREVLEAIAQHRKHRRLRTTLTQLLRTEPGPKDKGAPIWHGPNGVGITYPDWFATPSPVGKGDRDPSEGGTLQARVTCIRPPLQTYPPPVRSCITTRYNPGSLLVADLSQIEYRVIAVLSGDPTLLDIYRTGKDLHSITASAIYDSRPCNLDDHTRRQVGKKVNFGIVYGIEGPGLQRVLVEEVGLNVPLTDCYSFISAYSKRYPGVWDWRRSVMEQADIDGHVQIPYIGASRAVPGAGSTNKDTYGKIAVNFFPQAIAACVLLTSAHELTRQFSSKNLLASTGLQVYDSLYVECPASETQEVRSLMHSTLTESSYWSDICRHYGRSVPLEYDMKETTRA